jgi:hydroxymethylpyrimidine pyrophosphatase-like HAD family hydrolase
MRTNERRRTALRAALRGGTCVADHRLRMQYVALATDYDGTLAEDGKVRPEVLAALVRLKESGRKLVLVTGRELDDLMTVFPALAVFDRVVAENGALLYTPTPPREHVLAKPPPPEFAVSLRVRGVAPLSCGRVIVATWQPHEQTVLTVIREQGLELEVIFNKGAVMVLPSGVNKATGLMAALDALGIERARVVGAGDAENDHSLLGACGLGVAVANAVPALVRRADLVTAGARGQGIIELCERMLANDLADVERRSASLDPVNAPVITPVIAR